MSVTVPHCGRTKEEEEEENKLPGAGGGLRVWQNTAFSSTQDYKGGVGVWGVESETDSDR